MPSRFQDTIVQVSCFPLRLVLPFRQYCDRRLTFGKLAYIYGKAAYFTVLNLYCLLQSLCPKTFIENQKHAETFKNFDSNW